MLKELRVRDLALVAECRVRFGPGLNLLTGETGSGKSLIVDALSLTLGARAAADQVRHGADRATVEGVFESGGSALVLQRELGKAQTGRTFYVLDEPTTGLHFEDVRALLHVLNRLVDKGNTVIVIEHNLDVIQSADWIIDLGPEGGDQGGRVVAEGPPERIAAVPGSHTGEALRRALFRLDLLLTRAPRRAASGLRRTAKNTAKTTALRRRTVTRKAPARSSASPSPSMTQVWKSRPRRLAPSAIPAPTASP